MSPLTPAIRDAGKSVGLLNSQDDLNAEWFDDPLGNIGNILKNPTQRAAFIDLIDELIPGEAVTGKAPGEEWHPLLGPQPRGNVFLTVKPAGQGLIVGAAAEVRGQGSGGVKATLGAQLPLIKFDSNSAVPVAGTAAGPLCIALRIDLGWQRPGQAIGLDAALVELRLAPLPVNAPTVKLQVKLLGLDLAGTGKQDTVLDPETLGPEAVDLILGLMREKLRQIAADAGAPAEAKVIATHLLPLFGLGAVAEGIPLFPFAQVLSSPAALQAWLNTLIAQNKIGTWLGHLAGLFGSNLGVTGSGTPGNPWAAKLVQFGQGNSSAFELVLSQQSSRLHVGARLRISPGASAPARVEARADIMGVPLSGVGPALVVPSASVVVTAPGDDGATLLAHPNINVKTLRGGVRWDGTKLSPLLELENVVFQSTTFAKIDLTNADTTIGAANVLVEQALRDALGPTGVGANLSALIGLLPPAGTPQWSHTVDVAQLLANPTQAIAKVHRDTLLDTTDHWGFLLSELGSLIGLNGPVTGTGVRSDPWRIPLAPAGTVSLDLASWNEQAPGNPALPQKLRIGLRLSAAKSPWSAWWLAELLAFDLPQAGDADVKLMAGQHAEALMQPGFATPPLGGIIVSAASMRLAVDWAPGSSMTGRGVLTDVSVSGNGSNVQIPALQFPPPQPFDVTNPATSLGIDAAQFRTLLALLSARAAYSFAGMPGLATTALVGLHRNLAGLPADFPILRDTAGPGSMFTDPRASLRDWLARVTTEVSVDSTPFLLPALDWLRALLVDVLPPNPAAGAPVQNQLISGDGVYDSPWALPLGATDAERPVELLAWLEPAGPPTTWVPAVQNAIGAATRFSDLCDAARRLGAFNVAIRDALRFTTTSSNTAFVALQAYFAASDGVVPLVSQTAQGATWTIAPMLTCAHHKIPADPSAIQQVLTQLEAWDSVNDARAVLLIGPAFSDHTTWSALLAQAQIGRPQGVVPGAHFQLRVPGSDPLNIDLANVTAVADYYTANLYDDGLGNTNALTAQIGRVIDRIQQLRPGLAVSLVAHSTAGVAARAYTAANPAKVRGLITLGTPHLGASLTPLLNDETADVLRLIDRMNLTLPAGAVADAVAHLKRALDGYAPGVPGELPEPTLYPVSSFNSTGEMDTGGVPALAIVSQLPGLLFDVVKGGVAQVAIAAAATVVASPTHLSFGVRSTLKVPGPSEGQLSVNVKARVDAVRVKLQPGAPEPSRPPRAAEFQAIVRRPGGWVAGGARSFLGEDVPRSDVRVRWAEFGVTLTPDGDLQVTPFARLHDVAYHGPTQRLVDLTSATCEQLLGEVMRALDGDEVSVGSPADVLLDAMEALGVALEDQSGMFGMSADAFAAIQTDARAYLAPKLALALARPQGLLGLMGPANGPWNLPAGIGSIELYLELGAAPMIGIRTADEEPLAIGDSLSIGFDARLAVPALSGSCDFRIKLGAIEVSSTAPGTVTLAAPPWVSPMGLVPFPAPAAITSAINAALPRVLLSAAVAALLETTLGPAFRIGPIDRLLASPGESTSQKNALGGDNGFDGAKINTLLNVIAMAAGSPPGPGLGLPGGLRLTASGSGTVTIRLATEQNIGGVVEMQLDAVIDPLRHVTPAGHLKLHLNLPGTWGAMLVSLGISPAGVTLALQPTGVPAIQLLPQFSGVGALAQAGAMMLLPAALDALVEAKGNTPLVTSSIALAAAFDLANNAVGTGKFQERQDNWKAVLGGNWLTSKFGSAPAIVNATSTLFTQAGIPGVTATGGELNWSQPLPGSSGTVKFTCGWANGAPVCKLSAENFQVSNTPLKLNLVGGFVNNSVSSEVRLGFDLKNALRIDTGPNLTEFAIRYTAGNFQVRLLPLGAAQENALRIDLLGAPPVVATAAGTLDFGKKWLLPLVGDLLVRATSTQLATPLWAGGPTGSTILLAAGVIDGTNRLVTPIPPFTQLAKGLLTGLLTNQEFGITDTLKAQFVNQAPANGVDNVQRLGVRVHGYQGFNTGDFDVKVLLGEPATWLDDPKKGVTVFLFENNSLTFNPLLQVIGLGASFEGSGGSFLINESFLKVGGVAGYFFCDVKFGQQLQVQNFGGGLELVRFGLPLGQALSGNTGGENPVAAGLLQSEGGGGDTSPVNPTVDIFIGYVKNQFQFKIGGQTGVMWIGVHRSFGPIYIDQIGLQILESPKSAVALLMDGMVKVNGLTIAADDLSVTIPLKDLSRPNQWSLDLRGLGVSYEGSGINIAGGLIKNPGPPIQYDGMLQVYVAGKGFTAVGSYARPEDELGEYTSLFIFVSIGIPLGGPPAFFVLGLGGGAGFNRQLLVPTEITAIPNFLLVAAIDNPAFANNPLQALRDMATAIPPKRGSFWFAAGLKFSSFVIVNTTGVLYVAVDRGFEIGILGVSRMSLPSAEFAIAQIELALKARYNSVEGILSIQAQLTENSYLFHPSCQLTGGFAFFIWFPQGQFLLTLGGYHPAFQKRPEYPDVPRLGFRWIMGPVSIKGEAYFALTNTCVMAGGRLEAVYKLGPIRAWFIAYTDILVSWDPFHYDIALGLQIGVRVEFEVCFIGCATVSIGITLGAQVHIIGPPLFAEVTIDAYIMTVTVTIGDPPAPEPNYITDFKVFEQKYLSTGDSAAKVVGVQVTSGLRPPEPPGAHPAPGSKDQPWRFDSEFAFMTETRMPARTYSTFLNDNQKADLGASELDLAPMGKDDVDSDHKVLIFKGNTSTAANTDQNHFDIFTTIGLFPEATWHLVDKQVAASNTIPAISGLRINAFAFLVGQTKEIPIKGVVDDLPERSKPLPFATNTVAVITILQTYGAAAQTLFDEISAVASTNMLAAADKVLTDGGLMMTLRESAGIPARGISPMVRRTLRHYRSAPPMVMPMTAGLTMEPVGLPAPPFVYHVPDVLPVPLNGVRLRGVLQMAPQSTIDLPCAIHTTTFEVSVPDAPRMLPPKPLPIIGARLRTVVPRRAPRPTRVVAVGRALHNIETGVLVGSAHHEAFRKAADAFASEGVAIPAGTTHVWDLPREDKSESMLLIDGGAAVRLVFLSFAGRPVDDFEMLIEGSNSVPVPRKAASVAIMCLGKAAGVKEGKPGFAAVSFGSAHGSSYAAVGWESGTTGIMVGSSTVLARGAAVRLPRMARALHGGQHTTLTPVRLGEVTRQLVGVETVLPAAATVVMVLLDGQDPTAASDGDLAIAAHGAELSREPISVGGGRRRGLLYDVLKADLTVGQFVVSVGSARGWRVTGVVGFGGKAIEWVNRFHGEAPERIVPEGPLTVEGALRVRLVSSGTK